jgi:hypothetical protein
MTLNPGETSLVIAGAWNPAILVPAWVLRFGLLRPDGNEQVQIALPAGQGLLFDFPRYTLPEFTYIVRPDTLIINPTNQTAAGLAQSEDAAAEMLRNLPHTPVNGIGHNFEFRDADPDPGTLEVFTQATQDVADRAPEGWAPVSMLIASSFRVGAGNTIANVQRQFDGTNTIIKFNFHHPIADVDQALQVLRGQNGHVRMQQSFEIARNLVSNLYGAIG